MDPIVLIGSVEMLSIICLLAIVILYIRHKEHHVVSGKLVLTLSISNILFYTFDIIDVLNITLDVFQYIPYGLCFALSVLLYFFQCSSPLWTIVMAYDISHSVFSMKSKSPNLTSHSSRFLKYSTVTWLTGVAICLPAVIIDYFQLLPEYYRPQFSKLSCNFGNLLGFQIFFEAPYAIILLTDCIILGITMRKIYKTQEVIKRAEIKQQINRFYLCIKLVLVLGITEIVYFSLYAANEHNDYLLAVIVISSLRGVYILLIFGWKFFPFENVKNTCVSLFRVKEMSSKKTLERSAAMPDTETTDL